MATPERIGRAAAPLSGRILEAMPVGLLDEPLEYIFADHFRHRRICATLRRCAAHGLVPGGEAEALTRFLQRDLIWHHDDEDEDLFPALRHRSLPEDDLLPALDRLEEDHRRSLPMVNAIVAWLTERPDPATIRLDRTAREAMDAFAAAEHRHLALENGIVLAIARIRLTRGDLARISKAMKRRRGAPA